MTGIASTQPETAVAGAPTFCGCFGDTGCCGSTHRPDATGPACCDLCGLPVKADSFDGVKVVNPSSLDELGDRHGTVPSADDISDIDKPYASFAGAEWFVIVARGGLAFRYGPYDGPAVGKIMEQCQDEKIACLVTANCGPEFDWDLARDFCQVIDAAPVEQAGVAAQQATDTTAVMP